MGRLIDLAEARADYARPTRNIAAFFFALDCPISYLAAERVERILGEIDWVPTLRPSVCSDPTDPAGESILRAHERLSISREEAQLLRLPLIEPDCYPHSDVRQMARAVLFAGEQGAASRLALAALRLAFCGGFDLSESSVIAEAATAADLCPREVVAASSDTRHDQVLDATARGLQRR